MHHAKDKNQMTKTTLTNITQPPQHPSHNTRHKHKQNFNTLHHRHNQTNTIKPQDITTSTNNIATTSHPCHYFSTEKSTQPLWNSCYNVLTNQDTVNNPIQCSSPLFTIYHKYTVHH